MALIGLLMIVFCRWLATWRKPFWSRDSDYPYREGEWNWINLVGAVVAGLYFLFLGVGGLINALTGQSR
jgi:hypothetical protein